MLRRALMFGCVTLAATLVVQAALAHKVRERQLFQEPTILGGFVEVCPESEEVTCLHLVGLKLHDESDPMVTLDGETFPIHQLKGPGSNVFVQLPEHIEAGTRLVEVTSSHGVAAAELPIAGVGDFATPGYQTVSHTENFEQGRVVAKAECPEGSVVVGGGYLPSVSATIFANTPSGSVGWQIVALAPANAGGAMTVVANCINPTEFK
ncbi:MAG: hypothetical protein AAF637_18535 [Pseudomonadota bacterium]